MEVYLIRHTTPLVRPGQIYGWSDIPLSSTYAEEIEVVKRQLPEHFDQVFSSPSSRCTTLAAEIRSDFIIDERLCELNFGDWEGETWDTVDQSELQVWMDDFVHVRVPGGESLLEMKSRVDSFWDEIKANTFGRIALITHAGVIRILLAQFNSIKLADIFNIKVAYGEVFVLSTASDIT